MKYQLVLQWPGSALRDYDAVIELEAILIRRLSGGAVVDGHDMGVGEVNVFILTENPAHTFDEIKSIVGSQDVWVDVRVAYRGVGENQYTVLWPNDLERFEVL